MVCSQYNNYILFVKQFSIDWNGNKAKEARRKVKIKRTEKKEEGAGCSDDERVQQEKRRSWIRRLAGCLKLSQITK